MQPQWQTFQCDRLNDQSETNLLTTGLIAQRLWCRIGNQVITRQQKSNKKPSVWCVNNEHKQLAIKTKPPTTQDASHPTRAETNPTIG
jgi:hypothetical protein